MDNILEMEKKEDEWVGATMMNWWVVNFYRLVSSKFSSLMFASGSVFLLFQLTLIINLYINKESMFYINAY